MATAIDDHSAQPVAKTGARISAKTLPGQGSTFIEFALPEQRIGAVVSVDIFDAAGRRVSSLSHTVNGVLNHLSWNHVDHAGNHVGRGTYIVRLIGVAGQQLSTKFVVG